MIFDFGIFGKALVDLGILIMLGILFLVSCSGLGDDLKLLVHQLCDYEEDIDEKVVFRIFFWLGLWVVSMLLFLRRV